MERIPGFQDKSSLRPLARWTIGQVHPNGWKALLKSVALFTELYPEFDMVICHNNLTPQETSLLATTKIPIYQQINEEARTIEKSWWKLCPPRLRINAHELWIDNDLILHRRLPSIDCWLSKNTSITLEATKGFYGKYQPFVNSSTPLCAGLFGLPPRFDFQDAIKAIQQLCNPSLLNSYDDEQGLTSAIVTSFPDWILIPSTEVKSFGMTKNVKDYCGNPGVHLIGINRGDTKLWNEYCKSRLKYI